MRKLHEELQRHIHSDLCSEVNEVIISIKLHEAPLTGENAEAILKARNNHPLPGWQDIITLLTKVRDEMDKCQEPYRRY